MTREFEYPFITVEPFAGIVYYRLSNQEGVRTLTVHEDSTVLINVDLDRRGIATGVEIIGLKINPLEELKNE